MHQKAIFPRVTITLIVLSNIFSSDLRYREQFNISVSFLDLFEYVFHLNQTKMIDKLVWNRWRILTETIMTIPKFASVWTKTKESHPDKDFRDFIDSL